jgi:hypothetical protein
MQQNLVQYADEAPITGLLDPSYVSTLPEEGQL